MEVRKVLIPADDPGRFALFVDSSVGAGSGSKPNAGNGDTTGRVDIVIDNPPNFPIIQVGETAAAGTSADLAKYDVRIDCGLGVTRGTTAEIQGSITATDYVCTITNMRIPDACLTLAPFDSVVIGTEGADSLTGTAGKDLIYGFGGNDTVVGGDGADVLRGEAVPLRGLDTGTGTDALLGGSGFDDLTGFDITNGSASGLDLCVAGLELSCDLNP